MEEETMIVYLICYVVSFILARFGIYLLSGAVMIGSACWLYYSEYRKTRNLIHLRALFSLFWVGGEGIACLKLSRLQTDWSVMTWICLALAYIGFWVVFEILTQIYGSGHDHYGRWRGYTGNPAPVFHMICGLTVVSALAFASEAVVLGYVPFLVRGVPHAYSEFHLTGIHYITVSCVLIPSLTVLYFHMARGRESSRCAVTAIVMTLISLLIPILCVSRFQFIFAVVLATFTYISLQKLFQPAYLLILFVVIIPVYLILTVARSHDVVYLNGIFEMKWEHMPIFITQPYMYIANNYDNFDCLVKQLPAHSMGLKGMFPLWALSGLKFLKPVLVDWPIYVTKEELTTVTLFYDAYYDFGIAGVFFFSSVLGVLSAWLSSRIYPGRNPAWYLFYSQAALYFMLSFFTTWYSNPTTWFYFAVTGAFGIFLEIKNKRRKQL